MFRNFFFSDNYTKFILTVIAFCLLYLCIKPKYEVKELYAQSNRPIPVMIMESLGTLDVNIVRTVDVNIEEIDGKSFSPLDISTFDCALPVKIKD